MTDRTAHTIWKKKVSSLRDIVSRYKNDDENCQLGITSISGKIKIVRCVLRWTAYTDGGYGTDKHLSALKAQCEGLDIDGLLSAFDELRDWCGYRNEVIHGLMNKNLESLSEKLRAQAEKGMLIANYLDSQEKLLKKGNKVRRSANLQMR
ncbi:MAG: hypothetical protein IJP17_07835 [Clostridia bacterium]|nr:hypothetical protein [Clostridia bacterium]